MELKDSNGEALQISILKNYNYSMHFFILALFYMAHKLVDFNPDEAIAWYAVGSYFFLINKPEQGRRYLTKAATLDRLFGPAWLLYGHSFAKEKEHDQAMNAYFKATQLMRGCHLPLLYIGVECGLTKNYEMAEKFFYQAMSLAPLDVIILHELGVIKFESELYEDAEEIFRSTLSAVEEMAKKNHESLSERWEPLLNNLGHCCRKNKKLSESLNYHQQALSLRPLNSQTYTSIGFVYALMGKLSEAVEAFHKSLALKRDDVVTSTILKTVLEDLVEEMNENDEFIDAQHISMEDATDITESKENNEKFRKLNFDENEDSAEMSLDL
jgi:anaphase-promoting complex subunit 6